MADTHPASLLRVRFEPLPMAPLARASQRLLYTTHLFFLKINIQLISGDDRQRVRLVKVHVKRRASNVIKEWEFSD